jgi:hypothetical protein
MENPASRTANDPSATDRDLWGAWKIVDYHTPEGAVSELVGGVFVFDAQHLIIQFPTSLERFQQYDYGVKRATVPFRMTLVDVEERSSPMGYGFSHEKRLRYYAIYRFIDGFLDIAYGDVLPTEFRASARHRSGVPPPSAGRVIYIRLAPIEGVTRP